MIAAIRSADQWMTARHQTAYDYAWDRWGIYLGTIRAGLPALIAAETLLYQYAVTNDGRFTQGWLFHTAFWGVFLWFLPVKLYLKRDWEDQDKGRFAPLNQRALIERDGFGLLIRWVVIYLGLMMVFSVARSQTLDALHTLVEQGVALVWLYSLTLCARERDASRFKQHRLASSWG